MSQAAWGRWWGWAAGHGDSSHWGHKLQDAGLLLSVVFLHPEGGEDGSQYWRLLCWLCCGLLMVGQGSPSGEEGWLSGHHVKLSSAGGLTPVTRLGMG